MFINLGIDCKRKLTFSFLKKKETKYWSPFEIDFDEIVLSHFHSFNFFIDTPVTKYIIKACRDTFIYHRF